MSITELIVIAFGLFVGYWIVSRLMSDKPVPKDQGSPSSGSSQDVPRPSAARSWYEILEVQPHASVDEIKTAYKKLMSQYHPDKVASLGPELQAVAERKSKDINGAYREAMEARGFQA